MRGRVHAAGLCLGLAACQTSDEPQELAPLVERVAAADQRVATVQTRVDALQAKLDAITRSMTAIAAVAEAQQTEDERRRAEQGAERRRREQARRDLRARLGLEGTPPAPPPRPAPSTEHTEPRVPSRPPPRAIPSRPERPSPSKHHELEGARESIWCDSPSEGWIRCGIDRSFFDYVVANGALLERQGHFIPSMRDGKPLGFKLYGLRSGSLPRWLGFENGDLILTVNGEIYQSLDSLLALIVGPPALTHFDLDIERRSKPMIMTVDIVE